MPGSKEIRNKIKSVQNTRKITKAMEMVAASKMRKAQERMRHARPYGEKIRNVAAHISHANPEYRHPFLVERDSVKRVGIIVITTDKGLCGALNTNLLRMVLTQYKEWQAQGEEVEVCRSNVSPEMPYELSKECERELREYLTEEYRIYEPISRSSK
jgi:F-type H+-transporting ATPase subunit gamma